MKYWFFRHRPTDPASTGNDSLAYREGRLDEDRGQARPPKVRPVPRPKPRAGGVSPLSLVLLAIIVFGCVTLYLAARNGSFSRGGAVVDQNLSRAGAPLRNAETRAGTALESAGRHLKRDAGPSQP